jgi:hypothetical protein
MDNDNWNFINSNPAPIFGVLAHQSSVAGGMHQHYFFGASDTLTIRTWRYFVRVCLYRCHEPAQRDYVAMEQFGPRVEPPRLLGCRFDQLGDERHGQSPIHGCHACSWAMGAVGSTR